MRASRLLRILLLLQNRGRMTTARLAEELEVARRTILRDIDALTEAGLPIIVFQGNLGGVELGFNYRTRLTSLDSDEAEALAVVLSRPIAELSELGMGDAGQRARTKLLESLPDQVRNRVAVAGSRFRFNLSAPAEADPRLPALANAIRGARIVRLQVHSTTPRTIHPTGLLLRDTGWAVHDALAGGATIPAEAWGDINISARRFRAQHD